MKRGIVCILIILLLLPLGIARAVTTPVEIRSDDIQGNVGDTVSVPLLIAIEPPKLGQTMDSLQFDLTYNSDILEYVDIQEVSGDYINILGARYMCSVTPSMGNVAFAAAATSGTNGSGTLMHVRFKVLSAGSTMLALKKVSYSFVTVSSETASQRTYTGGTINLGYVTGERNTLPSPSASPSASPVPTGEPSPQFPIGEASAQPGASPTAAPQQKKGDALAYVMFGLFLLMAILICVILTLMIVRRSQRRRSILLDDDADEPLPVEAEEEDGEEQEEPEKPEESIPVIRRRNRPE